MSELIVYGSVVPNGWQIVNFNEIYKSISLSKLKVRQKDYLNSGKFPVVDQGHELVGGYFNDEKLLLQDPPFIVFGDHTKVKKYINFDFIAGADGVKVLKPVDLINSKLFFYFLHCMKLPDRGYARHFQFLCNAEFPLPPIAEQHRIVAKIEELFSELDNGIETLNKAKQQLKIYRQAVLKYAFEGKLTNPDVKEGELPEGWVKNSLAQITIEKSGLRRGPFGSAIKKEFFVPTGYKVYEQSNAIYDDHKRGSYFINETKYLELKNFEVKEGDFLVSCSGTLGRITQIPSGAKLGVINQALLRIRLVDGKLSSKYFLFYFRSEMFQRLIFEQSQGTAMNNLIGIKDFREITITYPEPIEQQLLIIQEIESRLSVCDKIEESIEQGLQQSEALRQSILKRAFEGKLVPQDPSDEPASVLLERIKAERAAQKPVKKTSTKKSRA